MKKTFALLVALMLLVAMLPGTAMAYTAVKVSDKTFPHRLTLTEANLQKLPEGTVIAYTYTVAAPQMMVIGDNGSYTLVDAKGVSGNPSITGNNTEKTGSVIFDSDSEFNNGVTSVDMLVNWDDVDITDPGVYLWKVTKAIDPSLTTNTDNNHSDYDNEFYIYVIVLNNNDSSELIVRAFGISMEEDLSVKDGNIDDTFPVKKVSLEIKKQVSGNMASANQYFPFKVTLSTLPGTYKIKGATTQVPKTAYNDATVNDTAITVNTNGSGSTTIWLKHSDVVTIEGLPYGTNYTIEEEITSDFVVSATIEGDKDATNNAAVDRIVSDTNLSSDTSVTYLNIKNSTVPTGIILNTAAPMAGILLALSMLAVLFIGKRKEYQA